MACTVCSGKKRTSERVIDMLQVSSSSSSGSSGSSNSKNKIKNKQWQVVG